MTMPKRDKRDQWRIIWNAVKDTPVTSNWKDFKLSNKIVKEAHIRKQTGLMWIRKAKAMQYLRSQGIPADKIAEYFQQQGIPVKASDLLKVKAKKSLNEFIKEHGHVTGSKRLYQEIKNEIIKNEIIGIDARFNAKDKSGGETAWEIIEEESP